MMDFKLIIVLLSVVWVTHGTQLFREDIEEMALLTCGRTTSDLPILPVAPRSSSEVWKPLDVPTTANSFKFAAKFSDARLQSLFRSTPGSINDDRQLIDPPTQSQIDAIPAPLGARLRDIDDILPLDSPFFTDSTSDVNRTAIREFVMSSGIGQCAATSSWTDLGEFYFPRYYVGVQCEEKNCSVPAGQSCQPNFKADPTYLNILHWHCCFVRDFNLRPPHRFTCGWRKARFLVPSFCECSCSPII